MLMRQWAGVQLSMLKTLAPEGTVFLGWRALSLSRTLGQNMDAPQHLAGP